MVLCADLTGKESQRRMGVDKVITPERLDSVMVN